MVTNCISHTVQNLTRRLQSLAAVLLLLIYVAASVEFEAIHEIIHSHDAHVTHTTADEQDPCHISLYHHADENGCHHKAHFTAEKKCPLCHIHHIGDKLFVTATVSGVVTTKQVVAVEYATDLFSQVNHLLPSRAPPSLA